MVKCEKYLNKLLLYLFDEIEDSERKEFKVHLKNCEYCRGQLEQLKITVCTYSDNSQIQPPELKIRSVPKHDRQSVLKNRSGKQRHFIPRFAVIVILLLITLIATIFIERKPKYGYWSIENSWEGTYEQTIKQMKQQIETIENDEFFE